MSRTRAYNTLADRRLPNFEPITRPNERDAVPPTNRADLHGTPEDPRQTRFGIHTNGTLFSVSTHTTPADTTVLLPYDWDQLHRAATRAGWAA